MNKSRKMLLSNNKKSILINVLLVLLASAEVIYSESDVDSFIVDDDKEETVKKSMLLSSGSMALGFMPKKKGSVVESFLPTVSGSSLHIKPSISLEKSLKTLDISGQKREILPKPSDSKKHNSTNNTIATTRAINTEAYNVGILKGVENIARNSTDDKNATSSVVKKTANLNVITNTSITGFLSKDPKFSIGDVGNQKDKEAVKENESEEKLHKNTTRSKLIGLKETSSYEEPIKKSNLHLVNPASFLMPLSEPLLVDRNRQENAVKKGEIGDHHYHDIECSEDKKCPKNKYCRHFHCYEGHRKHHECHEDDQCIDGMFCIYGRCDDKGKGTPGTICIKDGDCGGGCCVIEPTITEEHGICKAKLEEFHQCAPVLFRKVWIGDEQPKCGPCANGLECVERGYTK